MSRVQILSVSVDKVTMAEAVERCIGFLSDPRSHLVVTPNAEIVYAATHNPALAAILNGADLVVPDGAGVLLASRILGTPVPEKVAGVELATNLLQELSRRRMGRIYLLGATPEVVARAAERLAERFPGVSVVGFRDGFFSQDEESAVIDQIRASRPDVLFVGMGAPRQEFWLHRHLPDLGVHLGLGVGGTIDIWVDAAKRAPEWMIRMNLEWLFRIVRFGRYRRSLPPLVKFMAMVAARRLRGR
jgi:N-acetylglucosaminyldiphosphoundecaprenol N-acetyl-beta-D-mannosaminyltransferase